MFYEDYEQATSIFLLILATSEMVNVCSCKDKHRTQIIRTSYGVSTHVQEHFLLNFRPYVVVLIYNGY
jgi:hypothetical protein